MVDAADFTRERLIYLEIKDRQTSKLGYPLTDDQLRDIIADLAQRARTNPVLNAKELLPLITVPGGDEADIYEEITGGLLIPKVDAGIKEKYQVDPLRLVYGLGLLLAEELRSESSKRDSEWRNSWRRGLNRNLIWTERSIYAALRCFMPCSRPIFLRPAYACCFVIGWVFAIGPIPRKMRSLLMCSAARNCS
jgi:hypothetical protein